MKHLKRILICLGILMGAINLSNAQSNTAVQQNDPSAFNSNVTTQQQPDSTTQQSVTIAEPDNANAVQHSTTSYRATEKIRIYSGSQSGVNVIKTIEVPLPENSPSVSEVYVPH
jgi:hypothetical protein